MNMLITGVLIWSLVHLTKAATPGLRQNLVDKLGEKPYKGVIALLIIGSLFLIVRGWQSASVEALYTLPNWSGYLTLILMIVAIVLFAASQYQTAIRRVVRHPMLSGVIVWAIAHLLGSGSARDLVLFGGLGVWAILEIVLINRRDGAYEKPAAPGLRGELVGLFFTGFFLLLLLFLHPFFTGVSALG